MQPTQPMERREVHYSGRVQGVGFRYSARSIARLYAVAGYVKNLPDGRVEMVVEGKAEDVSALLRAITTEMGRYIRDVQEMTSPATGQFTGFDVRF
jgi:acylphosphatase